MIRPVTLCIALAVYLAGFGAAIGETLRVVVISDLNGSYGSTSYAPRISVAVRRIVELKPDLVISTGDMVAGQATPNLSEKQVRAMWRAFHATVSDPLKEAGIPFVVTPGNHDGSAYGGFENERRIFQEEWSNRRPDLTFSKSVSFPFFYAFDLKGVRFISLDATTLGALRGNQMDALAKLTKEKKTVVTFSHLPLWPVAINREREIIGDPMLEELYKKTGVDLHLSGHHHAYYPAHKDGVLYVAQACLGGGARRLIGTTKRSTNALTLVEIEDGNISISALAAPDFIKEVPLSSLPKKIVSPWATLTRIDLP